MLSCDELSGGTILPLCSMKLVRLFNVSGTPRQYPLLLSRCLAIQLSPSEAAHIRQEDTGIHLQRLAHQTVRFYLSDDIVILLRSRHIFKGERRYCSASPPDCPWTALVEGACETLIQSVVLV